MGVTRLGRSARLPRAPAHGNDCARPPPRSARLAALPPIALRRELTWRGMVLGVLICIVFTAANVYFGLKAGLTFASSIPAAVISMAVLRALGGASVQENNIVQTVASAAGTLASIIFVLPGLVMIGWWTGFPFWTSASICALGGVLGVMYSIPLRRALVTDSPLPYPEGVACAEVLRVGAGEGDEGRGAEEARAGLAAVVWASVLSAGWAVLQATRLAAESVTRTFSLGIGSAATRFDLGVLMALYGVGHLVGLSAGLAMLAGLLIAWAGAVPWLTLLHGPGGELEAVVTAAWKTQVRFFGAGAIGVAAIWALVKLARPVLGGLASSFSAQRRRGAEGAGALPLTEQDIPIGWVGVITAGTLAAIAVLTAVFMRQAGLSALGPVLMGGTLVYVLVIGFFVAAVCGYMAGLIGSSNSPVSGVGILAVLVAALLLAVGVKAVAGPALQPALVAFALFATALVFCAATVSNDNLQDLKTGQLVGATPWKQQAALVVGVLAGAAVIPPVLDLLNAAYGFAGAPNAGAHPLPAPQAALISTLAKGVLGGALDWGLIGWGAVLGFVCIALDEGLGRAGWMRLPPLAVGLGVYLPMSTTLMVVIGAVGGHLWERKRGDPGKRLGVLAASGLIVGESLMGVGLAAVKVASGKDYPLGVVGDAFAPIAEFGGLLLFAAALFALYRWTGRRGAALG